jgi:hypothetical protein
MALVEERYDFVCGVLDWFEVCGVGGTVCTSGLEACDVLADCFYSARAIGPGNDVVLHWEWVFAHGDDEITVVERGSVNWLVYCQSGPIQYNLSEAYP